MPAVDKPLKVAIVGLGPKGLFALERLLDQAAGPASEAALRVDLFEPHPSPGAGPVYDPSQPAYLRMNLGAESVGLWQYGNRSVPPAQQLSFVEWRRVNAAGPDSEAYPPRAQVGRYLADSLETLLTNLPDRVVARIRPARVERIHRDGQIWELGAGDLVETYDEVLISCGHQDSWAEALAGDWNHSALLVEAVFPVEHHLTPERVPPGAVVALRGFGLTFIDAALALSEGRGGRFEPAEGQALGFRYLRSGAEPSALLPFTRTGLTMHAKTEAAVLDAMPGLEPIGREGGERIAALPAGFDLRGELLPILADVTLACLQAAGSPGASDAQERVDRWLQAAVNGRPDPVRSPLEALAHSTRISAGECRPDLEWGLARAWLLLYPVVAPRLGGDALGADGWTDYRHLAREMERIAFGPPPINAAKLLALVDAGLVDLRHLAGGLLEETRDRTTLCSPGNSPTPVDLVVDAVLPEAGALGSHLPLVAGLLDDGLARVRPGRRGIDIAADGSCIGADGLPTPGLASIGRPTEDSVIDNDTLSRDRHPHPGLWAARILARARTRSAPTVGVDGG